MKEDFFAVAPEHVSMAATGAAVLLAYWLPRLIFRRPPSSPALLMLLGLLAYSFVPGMPRVLDPTIAPLIWEKTSEFVVIVVLFATGLRIDRIPVQRRWVPAIRLLIIAMPLTIVAVAALGWALAGMTVAGAVLLGAALAPTGPLATMKPQPAGSSPAMAAARRHGQSSTLSPNSSRSSAAGSAAWKAACAAARRSGDGVAH